MKEPQCEGRHFRLNCPRSQNNPGNLLSPRSNCPKLFYPTGQFAPPPPPLIHNWAYQYLGRWTIGGNAHIERRVSWAGIKPGNYAHMERRVSRAGIRPGLIPHIEGEISRAGIRPGNYATRRLRPGINATRLCLVALPTIMPSNYIFFNYYAFNLHF